jgi:hypothetical protein
MPKPAVVVAGTESVCDRSLFPVNPEFYAVFTPQVLRREDRKRIGTCPGLQPTLKDSPMYILRTFALFLFLTRVVLAEQPTPILPDAKLTPGDTLDVAA